MSAPCKNATAKGPDQPAGTPMPPLKKTLPGTFALALVFPNPVTIPLFLGVLGWELYRRTRPGYDKNSE